MASLRSQIAVGNLSASKTRTVSHVCKGVTPAKPVSVKSRDVTVAASGRRPGGRGEGAGLPGQMESIRRDIPVPEVDPENSEFVVFVRSKKYPQGKVFVPASQWLPLSIVKGGQAANALVKTCQTKWGARLFSNTLIRNISLAMYKDQDMLEKKLKDAPAFATVPKGYFEYAFKIRDKSVPKDWVLTEGITQCPPLETLEGETPQTAFTKFFSAESLTSLFN